MSNWQSELSTVAGASRQPHSLVLLTCLPNSSRAVCALGRAIGFFLQQARDLGLRKHWNTVPALKDLAVWSCRTWRFRLIAPGPFPVWVGAHRPPVKWCWEVAPEGYLGKRRTMSLGCRVRGTEFTPSLYSSPATWSLWFTFLTCTIRIIRVASWDY